MLPTFTQINISPREEHGNGARSGGVRGLSGLLAGNTPLEESARHQASVAADRSDVGNEPPSAEKADLVAARRRSVGVEAAPGAGDLCLSMAVGISPAQLVAFVASFREVSPLADLVMFFEAPASARFNHIIDK